MYISNALVRHIFSPTFIFFPDLSGGVVFLAGLVCLLSLPSACVKEGKWVCPSDVWRVAFVYCFMIKICFHCQYISRKRRSWGINRQWRCIWRMYRRNNPHIELIAEFSYNPLYSLFSFVFEIKLNRFRFSSILFSCGLWRETENIEIQVFSVTADCRPIAILKSFKRDKPTSFGDNVKDVPVLYKRRRNEEFSSRPSCQSFNKHVF